MNNSEKIIPYIGIESIKLYQTLKEVTSTLEKAGVAYNQEIWQSDAETIPNPWTVIIVEGMLNLFFARNDKLFKIVCWEGFCGELPNGIKTGISIEEAKKIDNTIQYDDWNEDYESEEGYWIEDDVETGNILSISIFIKEILNEDLFEQCDW